MGGLMGPRATKHRWWSEIRVKSSVKSSGMVSRLEPQYVLMGLRLVRRLRFHYYRSYHGNFLVLGREGGRDGVSEGGEGGGGVSE
jgi:hypothetical protein